MTVNPSETQTPKLPGYELISRLGAGGYGEVWLAHAPGGLTKAVKFVYGSYHERRAEHELKAMERIKEVRHPFLLSLERIEVVEGRLAIVTELADGSLKDLFDRRQDEGQRGIPRDELLKYLRDAADALDYLSQKHHLQHLDVKPENLLMVGGHVKVADFGLVKDLGATQASMVGGLTPLYSAPEVFQGDPSSTSDQYSLAILYQEMLTGTLPFPGATAAELTLQHLHDEPNLNPLPLGDRYLVARALSKDPSQRYASCSELVQALIERKEDGSDQWTAGKADSFDESQSEIAEPQPRRPGPVTQLFDEDGPAPPRVTSTSMLLDMPPAPSADVSRLPALDMAGVQFRPQPTLVIGVGGAAASVLRKLRAQLAKRFGDEPLPAVRMLLFDSDAKQVSAAMQDDPRTALRSDETMLMALKRPQDYREQSDRLMRWLSRRWLYNIPKSLRTEGLRPLGRLALADHARQAIQRIRMAAAEAVAPEAVAASTERSGLEFQTDAIRVILVSSISGGSGSGMSLDVAFAVRAALDKLGVKQAAVTGLLLHSADGDERRCDLARVNSYAWLTEYNHFHRPGGEFPGDESCGLPALARGRRAFDSAYLVDVSGEDDGESASDAELAMVADYAYLEALTPAQAFFDACRREGNYNRSNDASHAPLRTFSVRRISAASDASIDAAAASVARAVILQWTGVEASSATNPGTASAAVSRDTDQLVPGAAALVGQLQLKLEGLASNARGFIDAQFGGDVTAFGVGLLDVARQADAKFTASGMLGRIDALFAAPNEHDEGAYLLERPLDTIVSPLAMKLGGDLGRWVISRIDDRQQRLAGAQRAATWIVDHLKSVEADATRMAAALARPIQAALETARKDTRTDAQSFDARAAQAVAYLRMRIDHQAVVGGILILRRLLAEMKGLNGALSEFGRHLKNLARNLPAGADALAKRDDGGDLPCDRFLERIADRVAPLADAIDGRLQAECIGEHGGLFQTIMGHTRVRAQALESIHKYAREAVQELAAEAGEWDASLADKPAPTEGAAAANDALPRFLGHGGVYANLVVAPRPEAASAVEDATIAISPGSDVFVCCEAWQLPLPWVAADLIHSRRDYADFAARVQTRSDVAWAPLIAAPVVAASAAWPAMSAVPASPVLAS